MCDLTGRINSLRAEICKEKRKNAEELKPEKILKLCRELDQLLTECILSGRLTT